MRPTCYTALVSGMLLLLSSTHAQAPPVNATVANERLRRLLVFRQVFVHDYLAFHRKHRRTHKRLVFRLSDFQPGLGDRLTGFFHAYIAAVLSNRIFLVDWRHPFLINDLFYPNNGAKFYYDRQDVAAERDKPTFHCLSSCASGDLNAFGDWFTVVKNRSLPFGVSQIVRIARNQRDFRIARNFVDLLGENSYDDLGMPRDAEVFSLVFRAVFRLGPKLQEFMRNHAKDVMMRRYVSVHARLGEGVMEAGPRFAIKVLWERLADCMGKRAVELGKRVEGWDGSLFLATDTPAFREVFKEKVKGLENGTVEVLVGDWGTKHLARMNLYGRGRRENEDFMLFKFTLMEFLLLGKGVGIVSTWSRFSTAGAYVGGLKEKETVGVGKACKDERFRRYIQFCC